MPETLTTEALTEWLDAFEQKIDSYIAKNPTNRSDGNLTTEINLEREAIVEALAAPALRHGTDLRSNIRTDVYALMHSIQWARYIEDGHFESWAYKDGNATAMVAEHRSRIPGAKERLEQWRQESLDSEECQVGDDG